MFYVLFQFDREQVITNAYPDISWENKGFQLQCTRWLIGKTGKPVPSVRDFIRHKLRPIMKLADRDDLVREVYDIQNTNCLCEMERFRMQYGLSAEKFAGMAGIAQATVYYGMNGSVSFSLETEVKIMQAIRNHESKMTQS
ncbi:helix-turn-helix domain-containing protein [Lacrimispora brassicae]